MGSRRKDREPIKKNKNGAILNDIIVTFCILSTFVLNVCSECSCSIIQLGDNIMDMIYWLIVHCWANLGNYKQYLLLPVIWAFHNKHSG